MQVLFPSEVKSLRSSVSDDLGLLKATFQETSGVGGAVGFSLCGSAVVGESSNCRYIRQGGSLPWLGHGNHPAALH